MGLAAGVEVLVWEGLSAGEEASVVVIGERIVVVKALGMLGQIVLGVVLGLGWQRRQVVEL